MDLLRLMNYWSGELFLAQEMFEDAKLSFKNVVDNFYQHSRTLDSYIN